MSETICSHFPTVAFEGIGSDNPFAYRYYDAEKVVCGKMLSEHLRFAVAWWHSLTMNGSDPFGSAAIFRPWMSTGDPMANARRKADAAFELFRVLGLPFYTFHDRDISPEGNSLRESLANFDGIVDYLETKQQEYPTRLLWGTANPSTHQYDFDVATVFGFLKHFGLEGEANPDTNAMASLHDCQFSTMRGLRRLRIKRSDLSTPPMGNG